MQADGATAAARRQPPEGAPADGAQRPRTRSGKDEAEEEEEEDDDEYQDLPGLSGRSGSGAAAGIDAGCAGAGWGSGGKPKMNPFTPCGS